MYASISIVSRLKESGAINSSLFALGQVVDALNQGKVSLSCVHPWCYIEINNFCTCNHEKWGTFRHWRHIHNLRGKVRKLDFAWLKIRNVGFFLDFSTNQRVF